MKEHKEKIIHKEGSTQRGTKCMSLIEKLKNGCSGLEMYVEDVLN